MKICLFCEHKYAVSILAPLQEEARHDEGAEVMWYVDARHISASDFPYAGSAQWTSDIPTLYAWQPDVIFCPGNIVPFYLSGVKIEIFHGYAAEKKDHWVIRRYFDAYFTQGPFFTRGFSRLARWYKDFEVLETGWPRQDWIFRHQHDFAEKRQALLQQYGKSRILLYAPTFSPSLTSLPYMREALRDFAMQEDVVVLCKFHPLTDARHIGTYRQLADEVENIVWIDDMNVTPYMLMSDVMLSDTSSTIYEFLLLDKPVITLRAVARQKYWRDMRRPEELRQAFREVTGKHDPYAGQRQWVIGQYDPYLDGEVAARMLQGARDYIARRGIPRYRKVNPWRIYTSIKAFGWIPGFRTGGWRDAVIVLVRLLVKHNRR